MSGTSNLPGNGKLRPCRHLCGHSFLRRSCNLPGNNFLRRRGRNGHLCRIADMRRQFDVSRCHDLLGNTDLQGSGHLSRCRDLCWYFHLRQRTYMREQRLMSRHSDMRSDYDLQRGRYDDVRGNSHLCRVSDLHRLPDLYPGDLRSGGDMQRKCDLRLVEYLPGITYLRQSNDV